MIKVNGKVYSNNFMPLRETIIGGKRIAMVATIAVVEKPKSKKRMQVLQNWHVDAANVFATFPPFEYALSIASIFLDYIRDNFLQLNFDR